MLGNKIAHGFNIGGAALNDIARAVFHMPGKRQPLNFGKERITHVFHKRLRCLGVEHAEAILRHYLDKRHQNDARRHNPQMLRQVGKPAEEINQAHHGGGIAALFAADCIVQRHTDNLRIDHICQRR